MSNAIDIKKLPGSNRHRTVFVTVTGSFLYGTNTESSDRDYAGVFIPHEDYVFGLRTIEEIDLSTTDKDITGKNTPGAVDCKLYEIRKFLKLCYDCNPNIIEMLFAPKGYFYFDEIFAPVLENRELFISTNLVNRFIGYAISQERKMYIKLENYTALKDICAELETISDLSQTALEYFNERFRINAHEYRFGDVTCHKNDSLKKVYQKLKSRLDQYGHRRLSIDQFGYDTKFAMHTVRLLMEGIELMKTETIEFPLRYREELLKIKKGFYSIEQVSTIIEEQKAIFKQVEASFNKKPDFEAINRLCVSILKKAFSLS